MQNKFTKLMQTLNLTSCFFVVLLLSFSGLHSQVVTTPSTGFTSPSGIAQSSAGDVYAVDNNGVGRIMKIVLPNTKTVYSDPTANFNNDFNNPKSICIDNAGVLYVADAGNACVRSIPVGGSTTAPVYAGAYQTPGTANGAKTTTARFTNVLAICVNPATSDLYVVDNLGTGTGCTIRKITTTTVSLLAGDETSTGTTDGTGAGAKFDNPTALCFEVSSGDVLVLDQGGTTLRRITSGGVVTTITVSGAGGMGAAQGIVSDGAGGFFITSGDNQIKRLKITSASTATATSYAGNTGGTAGNADGTGSAASFNVPWGICIKPSDTTLWVADNTSGNIRQIAKSVTGSVVLPPVGTSIAYPRTTVGGLTYYSTNALPAEFLFSIRKNGATITNDSVKIVVLGTNPFFIDTAGKGNKGNASYLMKTSWDMTGTLTGGPVNVRFYYNTADSAAAIAARNADSITIKAAYPSSLMRNSAFEWFKTVGVPYDASWRSGISGNAFPATHTKLTALLYGVEDAANFVEFQVTSFSGGTGGAGFGPKPGIGLPVKWAGFDVKATEIGNELTWKTASEKNTSHFEVEYSLDGVNFIGTGSKVPAAGNSSSIKSYSFMHPNFATFVYYRVKQLDADDRFEYTETKFVKRTAGNTFDVSVYPTDLNNQSEFNVKVSSIDKSDVYIKLVDMTGKAVSERKVTPDADFIMETFNVATIQKGLYHLMIQNGQGNKVVKLMK